jgi:hypothetical protein
MPVGEFGTAREPVPPEVHLRPPAVDQEASRGRKRALCQRGSLGFGWRRVLKREQVQLPRDGIDRQVRVQESGQRVVGAPGRWAGLNERTGANHGDLPRGFELVDGARGRAPIGVVVPWPRLAPLPLKEQYPEGQHGGGAPPPAGGDEQSRHGGGGERRARQRQLQVARDKDRVAGQPGKGVQEDRLA